MSLPTPPWTSPEAQAALADDATVFPRGRAGTWNQLPSSTPAAMGATAMRLYREQPLLTIAYVVCVVVTLLAAMLVPSHPATTAAGTVPQPAPVAGVATPATGTAPAPATATPAPTATTAPTARIGIATALGASVATQARLRYGGSSFGSRRYGSCSGLLSTCSRGCSTVGTYGSTQCATPWFPSLRMILFALALTLGALAPLVLYLQARRDMRDGWARARGFRQGGYLDHAKVPLVRLATMVDGRGEYTGMVGSCEAVVGCLRVSSAANTGLGTYDEPSLRGLGTAYAMVRMTLPPHVADRYAGITITTRGHAGPFVVDPTWDELAVASEPFTRAYQVHADTVQDPAPLANLFTEDFTAVLAGTGGQLQVQQAGRDLLVFQVGEPSPAVLDALCRAALLVAVQFDWSVTGAAAAPSVAPVAQAYAPPAMPTAAEPAPGVPMQSPPPPPEEPPSYTHNAA